MDKVSLAFGMESERDRIVTWLRAEAKLCDCFARSEDECACGAWSNAKTARVDLLADAISRCEHLRPTPAA